jgi:membrane protease YdiL (CAAX protease family)
MADEPLLNAEPGPPEPPAEPAPPLPAEPEREPFWGYSDLFLFAGLAIPCMLLGWALVKGAMLLFHVRAGVRVAELLPEQFLGYAILFGALAVIFRLQYGRPFWRSLGWKSARIPFLWIVSCGLAAAIVVAFASTLIGTPNTSNPMTQLMGDRTSVILLAIFGITVGPLSEELVFRGFLQPLLVRSLGPALGIVAAAVPFGLLHFQEYGNSWRHAVLISAAGAAFGCMRHWTGSTKASTIMHAAYNALFFFAFVLQKNVPQH